MEDLKSVEEYLNSVDPFEIPLEKYRETINDESYGSLASQMIARRLLELHGNWIKEELGKRRAQSIVVCNGKVIFS